MKPTDTPCPHPSIVQLDQGDKITTQCTKCGKKINVRQKSDTDTPRTDEQIWTTEFDHTPCDVVDMPFARELERELAASQAESKTWHILYRDSRNETQKWKGSWFDLDEERQKLKAEIKELKESAERIGTNRYEQLKKAEAEFERLQSQLKRAVEIARGFCGCGCGGDYGLCNFCSCQFSELDQIKSTLNPNDK